MSKKGYSRNSSDYSIDDVVTHNGAWPIPGDRAIDTVRVIDNSTCQVGYVRAWSNLDGSVDLDRVIGNIERGLVSDD